MLKIKLARFGKKKQPHFRIVVNEARDKRDGQYIALLGQYAPSSVPKILKVDMEAYEGWIVKGAQPTETVAALIKRLATGNPFPEKKPSLSKKAKAKAAAQAEADAAPKAEPETVAPAAEATEAAPEVTETPAESTEPATDTSDTPAEPAA